MVLPGIYLRRWLTRPRAVAVGEVRGSACGRTENLVENATWIFLVGDIICFFPDVSVMIYTISVCTNRLVSTSKNYLFDHLPSYMSKYFLI